MGRSKPEFAMKFCCEIVLSDFGEQSSCGMGGSDDALESALDNAKDDKGTASCRLRQRAVCDRLTVDK